MINLFTIGHSTRSSADFLALLQSAGIKTLVDVRVLPASRWNPHFNAASLLRFLAEKEITYISMKELGGRREALPDSLNTGLKPGLRGYADYMRTKEFSRALDKVLEIAAAASTAVMCAEADPMNCHRQLIADAALIRGWAVSHIVGPNETAPHVLSHGATIENNQLFYPARQASLL